MTLAPLDWLIIGVYMLGMLGIGLWAMRKIVDPGSFMLGKRKMGRWMMVAATFGTGVSSNHPISVASQSYQTGFSGVWLSLAYMVINPFFWLFPPVFRRLRIVTMVDFFRQRYGREMEMAYNVINLLHGVILIGAGVKTAGLVITVVTAGSISEHLAQFCIVAMLLAYALPGGIIAAYATDLIQGLLIIVLSFVLLPFAAAKVGGFAGLHQKVPADFFELVRNNGISAAWIFWFGAGILFGICANPMMSSYGAARNEMAARYSVFGTLFKRFCTIGWMLTGIFAIALYGTKMANPDSVFAKMCASLLPTGLRGVMVASIFASVLSSSSSQMIFATSIFTNNIYQEFFVRHASPRHYLTFARVAGAIFVCLGWFVATKIGGLVKMVLILEQITAVAGVSVIGAIVWRRGTRWGAIASVVVMGPLFYYGSVYKNWPLTWWTPLFLLPGIIAYVLVSLFTSQHNETSVAHFYKRLDTPIGEESRLRAEGIKVDLLENLDGKVIEIPAKDHDISRRLLFADFLTWPWKVASGKAKLSDYRIDIVGFLCLALFTVAFISGVYYLARIGA